MKIAELFESLVTKIEMLGAIGRVEYFPHKMREDKPYRATIQDAKTKVVPPNFVKDFSSAKEAEDWLEDSFERFEKFVNSKKNMSESSTYQAVDELKSALLSKKDKLISIKNDKDAVYDMIDKMMQKISKEHKMTGKELHDQWVKKYKVIPDTWIMKD